MPHDEERIPGDRLAEEMEENVGWKCSVGGCTFESRQMPGAANVIMLHIRQLHLDDWENGTWSMTAIRRQPEKKGVSTSEYVFVCKRCKIKVIGCRARPCCYCESELCSECYEKAEYHRQQNHRRVDD